MNCPGQPTVILTLLALGLAGCAASSPFSDLSARTKQAADHVSDALTLKPKVTPATDPVSLASKSKPVPADFYTQAAWRAEQQGNSAAAAKQYQKALEIAPRDVTALISYARFLDRAEQTEEALQIYQRAQAVAPRTALVWNDLGLFHARRRQWETALTALNQAVTLEPNELRYRNNLAAVLVQSQHPDKAVQELEKVHPPAVARYNVACVLSQMHQTEAAAAYIAQAVQLDPSFAPAHALLATLQPPAGAPLGPVGASAERVAQQPRRLPISSADAPVRY